MSETVTIEGRKFSESTVKEALKAHCDWEKKYVPEAGDVLKNGMGFIRVVIRIKEGLRAVGINGWGYKSVEDALTCGYKKIGRISDFAKIVP